MVGTPGEEARGRRPDPAASAFRAACQRREHPDRGGRDAARRRGHRRAGSKPQRRTRGAAGRPDRPHHAHGHPDPDANADSNASASANRYPDAVRLAGAPHRRRHRRPRRRPHPLRRRQPRRHRRQPLHQRRRPRRLQRRPQRPRRQLTPTPSPTPTPTPTPVPGEVTASPERVGTGHTLVVQGFRRRFRPGADRVPGRLVSPRAGRRWVLGRLRNPGGRRAGRGVRARHLPRRRPRADQRGRRNLRRVRGQAGGRAHHAATGCGGAAERGRRAARGRIARRAVRAIRPPIRRGPSRSGSRCTTCG